MPSYFFHIAFELYPTPPPSRTSPQASPQAVYVPSSTFDLFADALPTHGTVGWKTHHTLRKVQKPSKTTVSSVDTSEPSSIATRQTYQRRLSHLSPGDRTHRPVPFDPSIKTESEAVSRKATLDWRFDSVAIQSIDMNPVDAEATRGRGKSVSDISRVVVSSGWSTKGKFIPGDPKNTNVGWGVVHLYRDGQETPGLYDEPTSESGSDNGKAETGRHVAFNEDDCKTLCILAVPSYMTPSDFLGWVGEQTREDVSNFRLIRTGSANKYMVLMKFRDAKKARQWRKDWNGKLFNSMEPENCHVVFVKSIHFTAGRQDPSSFPANTNDPFTPALGPSPTAPLPATSSPVDTPSLAAGLTSKPLPPPTPNLVELPTCPVCLERMDETTGLLAIMCQHVFHCACLEKWRGSGCPVCRYTQNDALAGRGFRAEDGDAPENECSVCGATANLWICLICGNIGCGRYDSAHAFAHWESTSHSYAMDIATQHVWDYAGDGYVHRLIQNKADGKLVDLPAAYSRTSPGTNPNGNVTAYGEDTVPRDKLDNMAMEYTYLLTHQLESQRKYYEETVQRAADKAAKATADKEEAVSTAEDLSGRLKRLEEQFMAMQTTVSGLEKDLARQTQKATTSADLARKMAKQYQEEKALNDAMSKKIKYLEEKEGKKEEELTAENERLKREVEDLREQVQDLNFFISGTQKMEEVRKELGDELDGASLEVGEASHGKGKKRRGRK